MRNFRKVLEMCGVIVAALVATFVLVALFAVGLVVGGALLLAVVVVAAPIHAARTVLRELRGEAGPAIVAIGATMALGLLMAVAAWSGR